MILGRDIHPASACFDELETAITALTSRTVCLNAHAFPTQVPAGAVVYNLENVGTQVQTDAFEGHELWDFSARNVERWKAAGRNAKHVPIGFHPSMKRFEMKLWAERDIDVVFCGCVNERRAWVLDALRAKGLKLCVIGPGEAYGAERDAILARSKLALNMLYEDGNTFPVLRAAHAAANGLPMWNEEADEMPNWVSNACQYEKLADCIESVLRDIPANAESLASIARSNFMKTALTLPDPWARLRSKASLSDGTSWLNGFTGLDLEAMYEAHRGKPVSKTPLVMVVVPTHRETEATARAARETRNAVRIHMAENGINSFPLPVHGDSLICRMRQHVCHEFLCSAATHLLFWDADIGARDPDCATKMVKADLPIVGGACPFKDMTGRTVHNLFPEMQARIYAKEPLDLPNGCIEARDVGTGFMMIQRRVLIELQQEHPELLHWSRNQGLGNGAPLWALLDTGVVDQEYRSEDYMLCHLWRQHGGKVYLYVPARFTHYGEHGFEASFMEEYGLVARAETL